ncbi:MAG TPA: sigma-70 family RNA polymerase sigma factor, partial [Blastocatellia bacterium]
MAGEVAEIALMMDSLGLGESSSESENALLAPVIERARAGDAAAFEQIIDHCQRKVISTAWRILGNREDARDAAQDVFLRAYKYLGSFDPEQDFSGWLYRIIVNVCRDIARKRGRADQFKSFEAEREMGRFETLASNENIEAAAMHSQEQAIITQALSTLSKKERAAIVLRDLEGLSTEEVARILGSSQTTVRSQIAS